MSIFSTTPISLFDNGTRVRTIAICLAGAAAALALVPSGAASAPMVPMTASGQAVAPAEALPVPGGAARPFRRTALGKCTGNACVVTIYKVPAGKQLQIEAITCGGHQANAGFRSFNLTTKSQIATPEDIVQHFRAFIPGPHVGGPGYEDYFYGAARGPYFFKADERVFITSEGSASTCTVSGYLVSLQ
jgi:hypothetical protein